MKALKPGHQYQLESFEGGTSQILQFIEKAPDPKDPSKAATLVNDGTTNEEVLAMLIDRLKFLGEKVPSRENSLAITKCEEALMWLEKRTKDRQARGVEGTYKK